MTHFFILMHERTGFRQYGQSSEKKQSIEQTIYISYRIASNYFFYLRCLSLTYPSFLELNEFLFLKGGNFRLVYLVTRSTKGIPFTIDHTVVLVKLGKVYCEYIFLFFYGIHFNIASSKLLARVQSSAIRRKMCMNTMGILIDNGRAMESQKPCCTLTNVFCILKTYW